MFALEFQEEQVAIVIITLVLCSLFVYVGNQVKRLQSGGEMGRLATVAVELVQFINNMTYDAMGTKYGRIMSAYIGSVFVYLIVANTSGLWGLETPTTNLSVTLALSIVSWVLIQVFSIKHQGAGSYLKGYLEPFALFLPMNILGELGTLLSLSLRLFGNVVSGATIMGLLYAFGAWLSSFVPVIGGFNFVGPLIGSVLHLYFDLFSGFLQAYIFISLTAIFIGTEVTD